MDLTQFVGGDEWTQRTYNEGEACIHNNKAWVCLATTSVEPSESVSNYWRQMSLKNARIEIKSTVESIKATSDSTVFFPTNRCVISASFGNRNNPMIICSNDERQYSRYFVNYQNDTLTKVTADSTTNVWYTYFEK